MTAEPHSIPIHAAAGPAPRRRRPILLLACWSYLLVLIAIVLTMRFGGDRWWPATVLLLAARWPFALPLLVLWPWALMARRWQPIVITAATTGILLFPILGLRLALPQPAEQRGALRLLTCNVHRQHLNADLLAEFIKNTRPDVIAIQGWSESQRASLFGSASGWNIRTEGELLVASRFEIGKLVPLVFADSSCDSKGERGVAALVELTTPQGLVSLINLHLASPHAGLLTFKSDRGEKLTRHIDRRRRESGQLLDMARRVNGPLILAGDFNTTDDSPIFREHWSEFADAFTERGSGFGYTYIIKHTQLRIDHILAGPTWQVARCWVGPDVGSAHHPLVADLNPIASPAISAIAGDR